MQVTEKKKLTLRVDGRLIERAKEYASQHDMSVSQLVETFLRELERRERVTSQTPVLDQLAGILPQEANVAEYYQYLEQKYGGD